MAKELRKVKLGVAVQADERVVNSPYFEKFYKGIEWLLARDPWVGYDSKDYKGYYNYITKPQPTMKTPGIFVIYKFDDNKVEIFSLDFLPYEKETGL